VFLYFAVPNAGADVPSQRKGRPCFNYQGRMVVYNVVAESLISLWSLF